MKDLTTISSDLFNKIRSRFSDIKIGDENGALTTDPAKARFFDVNFKEAGKELGRVNIKVDDKALTVIYNHAMVEDQAESVKQTWFNFLKEIRQFARSNMLNFDTRDITKSNLEKRDYKYLAQKTGEDKMSESKLFGTSKTSYQDVGEAKIIVKHSQPVNYNIPAGRTQHIEAIYIESANGERFRYPHRHLNGARAMARHVANGGTAYDSIGSYISGLSEELSKLRQFKNYTQRSGVMAEALGDITEKVASRIDNVKLEIAALQKQNFYEAFKENFQPGETVEVPEDVMSGWVDALTIKTFNEELKSVFPFIYKLVSEKQEGEIRYDDLVGEESTTEDEEESIKEDPMFADFENKMDELASLGYEVEEESDFEEVDDSEIEGSEEVQEQPVSQGIPQEVVEFIASMYDSENGTFPKGEEGVKIACEKKFGEQAGRFAEYVVEKLSAKNQEETIEQEVAQEQPVNSDLARIRALAGF